MKHNSPKSTSKAGSVLSGVGKLSSDPANADGLEGVRLIDSELNSLLAPRYEQLKE